MRRLCLLALPWAVCLLLALQIWAPDAGANGAPATPAAAVEPRRSVGAGASRSRTMTAARSAQAARLQLSAPLTLTATVGRVGAPIYASATVKNVGDQPIALKTLVAAGRGPSVPDWDCGARSWSTCGADFEAVVDLVLQPGQEHAYREVRVPAARGAYWAELVYQDAATLEWRGVPGANRVAYDVSGGELAVVQPLALTPASPRPGQVVAATARVKNVGDEPLPMRYLLAAGRGPDCVDWDCDNWNWEKIADFSAAEDVTLQPGEEYAYYGLTGGRARGAYFAEISYRHVQVDAWREGLTGSNRVTYQVGCDARCELVARTYRDVLGREPDLAAMRVAYESGFDASQLRAFVCGAPDRKPGRCAADATPTPLQRFLGYLPLSARRS